MFWKFRYFYFCDEQKNHRNRSFRIFPKKNWNKHYKYNGLVLKETRRIDGWNYTVTPYSTILYRIDQDQGFIDHSQQSGTQIKERMKLLRNHFVFGW